MLNNDSLGKCLLSSSTFYLPLYRCAAIAYFIMRDLGRAFPCQVHVGVPPASALHHLSHFCHDAFPQLDIIALVLNLFTKLLHRMLTKCSGMHVTSSTNGIPVVANGLRGERGWVWGPLTPQEILLRQHSASRTMVVATLCDFSSAGKPFSQLVRCHKTN
jgi:hypothetical protein